MSATRTLYVSNGRTVIVDGGSAGPGDHVTLPRDDAERLMHLGFLQTERPIISSLSTVENPSGVGLQAGTVQGPIF